MTSRQRSTRRVQIALGSAASVGTLALIFGLAVPVLPERSQRVLCAALRGICDVIAPETQCLPMPIRPFDGQATPTEGVCPGRHPAINGSCWIVAQVRPPCPVGTWEHQGVCYAPLMLPGRKPPTPNAQEP
ncbi:MAG TPA: hypothetical protein VMY76_00665 [Gemmatimonadales bacterium]|nr:hypothetical protein [Gemmatimonadales bacterium]